jgi:hypothetical protein
MRKMVLLMEVFGEIVVVLMEEVVVLMEEVVVEWWLSGNDELVRVVMEFVRVEREGG